MDEVFKALADPTRRGLLDSLFEKDGQTQKELEEGLEMTRFGVMKHLKVLEEAGLVVTRRRGREKLEVDPPRRLVQTFNAMWADEVRSEPTSRVTWEIEPVGTSCRLTVTHDQLRDGANNQLYGGWPMILSGIKTLIETGELLDTPGSLQYLEGRNQGLGVSD